MNRISLKGLAIILLLFTLTSLFSQRPKVGVVLSGGGAKGLAHVGILKAIDSAGLKVDYITGTSMGSIIGAMYAAGYSGKQIEHINKDIDWDIMLSGKPQYKTVSMEERRDYNNYAIEVPMKDLKPVITTGMVESEEIYIYFNKIFFPYYQQKDFTKLSIPFKCIATDLATGNAMVIDSGEVVKAIRASMAIPGVFESVTYGDKKYVDGGIIRNFPVTDCKMMGAEYIIGVNLFPGLFKVDELNNAMDVMYQITQYRDAADLVKEKELCNMLIEPPLSKYSAGSFGDSKEIEAIGREVGRLYYPYFKKLADSINALQPIVYDPEMREKGETAVIVDAITFEGLKNVSEEMLTEQLEFKPGKIYTEETLEEGIRKAYSSLYYKTVHYKLNPTTKGHANLHVMVRENELAAIKVALNFHSFTGAALMLNVTRRNLLFDKSKTMVKVALSENFRVYGEQKQFFGRKMSDYLSASAYFDNMENDIYSDDQLSYVYSTQNLKFNFGYTHQFGLNQELRAGINYNRMGFEPMVSSIARIDGQSNHLYTSLRYTFNSTDRRMFPKQGNIGFVEVGSTFNRDHEIKVYKDSITTVDVSDEISDHPFTRFKFKWNTYYATSERLTLMHNIQASVDLKSEGDDKLFYFDNSYLGGVQTVMPNQMPFYGYHETQINTPSFASCLVGAQYEVYNDLYLSLFANIGASKVYYKDEWLDNQYMKFRSGASVQVGYNLAAFPIEFNFMYSPEVKDFITHVSMGYNF